MAMSQAFAKRFIITATFHPYSDTEVGVTSVPILQLKTLRAAELKLPNNTAEPELSSLCHLARLA